VQRRQLGDFLQPLEDLVVDAKALPEIGASVHDPDAGGVEICGALEKGVQRIELSLAFERLQVLLRGDLVAVEQAQLERAGAGIDDE
jgi:hypothetical protein